MTIEMEALADKICREELKQEPNDENLAFRKTLVHGMVRWDEESKVKNLSSNPVVSGQFSLAIVKKAFETFHYVGFPHNHPTWEEWAKENLH